MKERTFDLLILKKFERMLEKSRVFVFKNVKESQEKNLGSPSIFFFNEGDFGAFDVLFLKL